MLSNGQGQTLSHEWPRQEMMLLSRERPSCYDADLR